MKRDIEYFTDHTVGNEHLRLGDHEVYLGFNNDSGAYAFHDWWREYGLKHFEEYCKNNLDEFSDIYG